MIRPMIAVIDYGMGNLRSVAKALEVSGARVQVTDSPLRVRSASGVVLPGVGAFGQASQRLHRSGLMKTVESVLAKGTPFLGICLGLQLLFDRSEESPGISGIGFFRGVVRRFRTKALKVPHMGWNTLSSGPQRPAALRGTGSGDYFYFVHSFYPDPLDVTVIAATTDYGERFCSAAAAGNVVATQFHPEKSGKKGLRILSRFMDEVRRCS